MKLTLWFQDGAEKVEVNRTTGVATVTMKEGKTLTRETVENLFKDTQYKVTDFKHVEGPDLKKPASYTVTLEGVKAGEGTDELIEKLKAIKGVESVSLKESTATIEMKAGEELKKEAVDAALKDTAYKCTGFEAVAEEVEDEKKEESEKDESK